MINKNNYEAFLLDYIEGTIGKEDAKLLTEFLDKNPELKLEMEDLELVTLPMEQKFNFDKNSLKRTIGLHNAEEYIIASIENVISTEDKEDLEDLLSSSNEAKELFNRYEKTILPIEHISFPHKKQLKRKNNALVYLTPLAGAAAVALLFILTSNFEADKPSSTDIPIAETDVIDSSQFIQKLDKASISEIRIVPIENIIDDEKLGTTITANYESSEPTKTSHLSREKALRESIQMPSLQDIVQEEAIELAFDPNSLIPINDISFVEGNTEVKDKKIQAEIANVHARTLTMREWLNKNIRERIFNQESADGRKIEGKEILMAIAEKLNKSNSRADVAYNQTEERTSYAISIGNFEFSRSKQH